MLKGLPMKEKRKFAKKYNSIRKIVAGTSAIIAAIATYKFIFHHTKRRRLIKYGNIVIDIYEKPQTKEFINLIKTGILNSKDLNSEVVSGFNHLLDNLISFDVDKSFHTLCKILELALSLHIRVENNSFEFSINKAQKERLITWKERKNLHKIRIIRNKFVHRIGFKIEWQEFIEYFQVAFPVILKLSRTEATIPQVEAKPQKLLCSKKKTNCDT